MSANVVRLASLPRDRYITRHATFVGVPRYRALFRSTLLVVYYLISWLPARKCRTRDRRKFRRWWSSPSTWYSVICKIVRAYKSGCSRTWICGSRDTLSASTNTWTWCWMTPRSITRRPKTGSNSDGSCWRAITSRWYKTPIPVWINAAEEYNLNSASSLTFTLNSSKFFGLYGKSTQGDYLTVKSWRFFWREKNVFAWLMNVSMKICIL